MKAKPCPFCGEEPVPPVHAMSFVKCDNARCLIVDVWIPFKAWNHRPKPKKRKTK